MSDLSPGLVNPVGVGATSSAQGALQQPLRADDGEALLSLDVSNRELRDTQPAQIPGVGADQLDAEVSYIFSGRS